MSCIVFLLLGRYLISDIFAPEKIVYKSISYDKVYLEWFWMQGIMDHNFPHRCTVTIEGKLDTICTAYNMANVEIYGDTITIGFVKTPVHGNYAPTNSRIGKYAIKVDTTYTYLKK